MKTLFLNENQIEEAADILKKGGIVAIPTETVYGLAANAFDKNAILKIFIAKGRPNDNPLIVHISSVEEVYKVVSVFSEKAGMLAQTFWPGPLTIILPKNPQLPPEVTAGMDSVAVRFPANQIAQNVIKSSGFPLAAPSANLSGAPSPTAFEHVVKDLNGKIDAVIDGGKCEVGLESTVLSLADDVPKLLRPGAVTLEDIQSVIGKVEVDKAVHSCLKASEVPLSPGMKYKHYAPKTPIIAVKCSAQKYVDFVNSKKNENVGALCFDEDIPFIKVPYISYGKGLCSKEQAKNLFGALRKADALEVNLIYAHVGDCKGIGMAVYNRLIKAAGFEILEIM